MSEDFNYEQVDVPDVDSVAVDYDGTICIKYVEYNCGYLADEEIEITIETMEKVLAFAKERKRLFDEHDEWVKTQ